MAKESNMKISNTSKYRHPPKATFDVLSDRRNKKKSTAKMGGREFERVPKVDNIGSIETKVPPPVKTILVELGALHKILDGLRPDDIESTSAWYSSESCCREIVLRFQNLLREWASDRKKLDQCIDTDDTLVKCEKCGVFRCLETPAPPEIISTGKKFGDKSVAEQQTDSLIKTSIGMKRKHSKNVVDHSHYRPSEALACSWERNALKINRLSAAAHSKKASTETSDEPVRKNVSSNIASRYEETGVIDTHDLTPSSPNVDGSREKFSDIVGGPEKQLTLAETIEYLARGNFDDFQDTKPDKDPDNATLFGATPLFRVPTIRQKPIFDLHGSRDFDFHRSCNFLSNDCRPLKSRTSDTSNFSTSSTENLMHQWMKTTHDMVTADLNLGNKSHAEQRNPPGGIRNDPLINETPDLATQIAEAINKFAERSAISKENYHDKTTKLGKSNRFDCQNDASVWKTKSCTEKDITCTDDYAQMEQKSCDFLEKVPVWERESLRSVVPVNVSHFSTETCSKMMQTNSISALTLLSPSRSLNYQIENSELFEREILYDEISSHGGISREGLASTVGPSEILPIYRKILESSETMDWESFERLVTALHPSQRELWCDICNAVSNEAKRVADETGATTEICIEINPRECVGNVGEIRSQGDEITFELDMTLQDVRAILETRDRPLLLQASTEAKE